MTQTSVSHKLGNRQIGIGFENMSFSNEAVPDNEPIVLATRKHPVSQMGPFVLGAALGAVGFCIEAGPAAMLQVAPSLISVWRTMDEIQAFPLPVPDGAASEWLPSTLGAALGPAMLSAGAFVLFWTVASFRRTSFVVTRRRILATRGVVSREVDEIAANMIRAVEMRSGFLGGIFGYGNVVVKGFGRDDVYMSGARRPMQLLRAVESVQV